MMGVYVLETILVKDIYGAKHPCLSNTTLHYTKLYIIGLYCTSLNLTNPTTLHQTSPYPTTLHQTLPYPTTLHQTVLNARHTAPKCTVCHQNSPDCSTPHHLNQTKPYPTRLHQTLTWPMTLHQAVPYPTRLHQTLPWPITLHVPYPTRLHQTPPYQIYQTKLHISPGGQCAFAP